MKTFLLPLLFCYSFVAYGQNNVRTEEKAIMRTVEQLFDGMRKGDSSMVRASFTEKPDLFTVAKNREGKTILHRDDLQKFLKIVGTPHEKVWDEPIWDTEIRIDGNLAQVWTKYAFYAGKDFSHCGVDAFHLFKGNDGWKIFHLTDTRQYEDCNIPKAIKKARE